MSNQQFLFGHSQSNFISISSTRIRRLESFSLHTTTSNNYNLKMDASSFVGTFMIANRRRENSTSNSGSNGSSVSGTSYGSSGSSYGTTPSSSGSYFPQSRSNAQNGYGSNKALSKNYNGSMQFLIGKNNRSVGKCFAPWQQLIMYQRNRHSYTVNVYLKNSIHSEYSGLAFI